MIIFYSCHKIENEALTLLLCSEQSEVPFFFFSCFSLECWATLNVCTTSFKTKESRIFPGHSYTFSHNAYYMIYMFSQRLQIVSHLTFVTCSTGIPSINLVIKNKAHIVIVCSSSFKFSQPVYVIFSAVGFIAGCLILSSVLAGKL